MKCSSAVIGHEAVCGDKTAEPVVTFTFNDTIIFAYKIDASEMSWEKMCLMFNLLKGFIPDSLRKKILFRGVFAIGSFFIDQERNIIMGEAVADAAAWHDKAEWVGIHATPRTSIIIQQYMEQAKNPRRDLIVPYSIPFKKGVAEEITLLTVNWPECFFETPSPQEADETPKEGFLRLLSEHQIPKGTEQKYDNTVKFFDHITNNTKRSKSSQD